MVEVDNRQPSFEWIWMGNMSVFHVFTLDDMIGPPGLRGVKLAGLALVSTIDPKQWCEEHDKEILG